MSNSLTTYVCEGSEVVELFVFFCFCFLIQIVMKVERIREKKDLNNWFHQTGWDYKGLYTVLGKILIGAFMGFYLK